MSLYLDFMIPVRQDKKFILLVRLDFFCKFVGSHFEKTEWRESWKSLNYISLPSLVGPLQSQQRGAVCIQSNGNETLMAQLKGVN